MHCQKKKKHPFDDYILEKLTYQRTPLSFTGDEGGLMESKTQIFIAGFSSISVFQQLATLDPVNQLHSCIFIVC